MHKLEKYKNTIATLTGVSPKAIIKTYKRHLMNLKKER